MLNIKMPLIKTKYNITKVRNGTILQSENFHNIILYNFIPLSVGSSFSEDGYFSHCVLGSGSAIPNKTDQYVTSVLWTVARESSSIIETSANKLQRTWQYTYRVPANTSYEGTVRELALARRGGSGYSVTHALITDAEHNPIEIVKTYLDELIITANITIIRPSYTTGFTWAFAIGALSADVLNSLLTQDGGTDFAGNCPLPQACPEYAVKPYYCKPTAYTKLTYDSSTRLLSATAEYSGDAKNSTTNSPFIDYINSIGIGRCYARYQGGAENHDSPSLRILFPNSSIFPVTTLSDISLGTGDGVTTDFSIAIPAWVANTEVVYIDGVAQTRGVDYLVDNLHNLSKKCSVMICNFAYDIECANANRADVWLFGTMETNGSYSNKAPVVTKDQPIIITYDSRFAFSDKFNYYVLGSWTASASVASGAALVFYYSLDNKETWTELGRISHTANNATFADTSEHTLVSAISGITNLKIALENTVSDAYVYLTADNGRLGYVGEYAIRFLTAPAQDAVLSIDIDIDRPWKDTETHMQVNPIINFGI